MYRHMKDGPEITVLEEDDNWILGFGMTTGKIDSEALKINVFCKECLFYVGLISGIGHNYQCKNEGLPKNKEFIRKAQIISGLMGEVKNG